MKDENSYIYIYIYIYIANKLKTSSTIKVLNDKTRAVNIYTAVCKNFEPPRNI